MDTRFVHADTVKLPAPDTYDVAIAAISRASRIAKEISALPDDEAAVVDQTARRG